ncbi:hypothetical protein [Streptomyces chryseus]|uniref:Uncharacterized protein n=1 Tax=Streptomyces chryseus TaxID=68186 RepID=A0ABQ3E4J2_9ACTN|nr:hypothetical protein [Streptomyces chryseus]GHB25752.1 hypothetical protein GCM10010346_56670 [Streptomyces chryseus]
MTGSTTVGTKRSRRSPDGTQVIEDKLKQTRDTYRDAEAAIRDGFAGKGGAQ